MLKTDSPNLLLEGYGLTFTLGRGNEIICDMCRSLQHLIIGKDLEADILPDMMGWSRTLTQDGQLRWIGPECVPSPRAAPSGHPPLQRSACALLVHLSPLRPSCQRWPFATAQEGCA